MLKHYIIPLLILLIAISCRNNTAYNAPTTQQEITLTTNTNKPLDTTIVVKDDFSLLTQADEEKEDKTHMDMSYFPSNYALEKAQGKPVQLILRVTYSRPHKRDRSVIFGDSTAPVPYNKLWRLGANETTELELIKPVTINNTKLIPGRYTLYAIPNKNSWKIMVNSNLYTWGDFNYDNKKDLVTVEVPVQYTKFSLETFLIYFQKNNTGCSMILTWDNVLVAVPIVISGA